MSDQDAPQKDILAGRLLLLGKFHGGFGVKGEVKLESFTEPPESIFKYQTWTLRDAQGRERTLADARGRATPKGVVARVPGIEDRDAADAMRGTEVWVPRSTLPPPAPGEYYWVDLEGLRVVNLEGVDFGTVSHLFSTGVNYVLVVRGERERMIPFAEPDYVKSVDFDAGLITVDWDADF